ncbi:hypothetical protein PSV08DRAFT_404236 [Bipolaris maydis]|uniref:uncharacterized protein n=1 Tax=Cochliobolus heterostrophus TaxID=5016 RepID=UPI0024D18D82|nr:hypothetical protein J3E73DRAFT_426519 [Bipolaris maydis]KAJ6267941.1 hypothetical protein PSV08DRAFT_404236 [Bipolaris maydis]
MLAPSQPGELYIRECGRARTLLKIRGTEEKPPATDLVMQAVASHVLPSNSHPQTWFLYSLMNPNSSCDMDTPISECLQQEGVERDLVDAFLQYTDSSVPSRGVQQAKTVLNQIANNKAKSLNPRRAWVDSRMKVSGRQSSPRWLTPGELEDFIKERSTNALSETDAIRRLIFIQGLDRSFVRGIARSSSWNEVSALRLAIRSHLAREACIKVRIPYTGFTTFHLEFSLPYLVLEEQDRSKALPIENASAAELLKTNLSFLSIGSRKDGHAAQFSIWKVHETVLISGCDSSEWTGYAFSSFKSSAENIKEEDDNDVNEDEDSNEEIPEEDLFATGGTDYDDHQVLDARTPIWDPRVYFLTVFAIRMRIIYERYEFLASTLRSGVENWIGLVLHELSTCLSDTIAVWERFHSVDGDVQYFSDIKDRKARLALKKTRESFQNLKFELRRLKLLKRALKDATVTLRMDLMDQLSVSVKENLRHSMDLSKHSRLSQKFVEENIKIARANVPVGSYGSRSNDIVDINSWPNERNFLSIDRSPKAFVLSIPIVLVLLSFVAPCVQMLQLILSTLPALLAKTSTFERITESSVFKTVDRWMSCLYHEVDEVENNV